MAYMNSPLRHRNPDGARTDSAWEAGELPAGGRRQQSSSTLGWIELECRMVKRLFLRIPFVLAPLPLLAGCNGPNWHKQEAVNTANLPIAVRVAKPRSASEVELAAPLSGVVRAKGQVQIAFQVAGQVSEVLVSEGDAVSAGQPLARLDDRLLAAQREQAAGAFAQAEAALQMALNGTRPQQIAQAKAQAAAAKAKLQQVEADYQRAQELFGQGVISGQALDTAVSSYEQTKQALISAEEQLAMAQQGPREEEVAQARAIVQQTRGALMLAETQLAYATLTAPSAGVVVMKQLEPGLTVSPGIPVIEIANLHELEVWTEVPEGDLTQIQVGDVAEITFPTAEDIITSGEIISIAPNAQPMTRGFPVKIKLPDSDEAVVPGMVALISFDYLKSPGGLVIPARAILNGSVFVAKDGIASRKAVVILKNDGERAFVQGLEPTDQVVINGQHFTGDGSSIRIVDALAIEELTRMELY